MKILLKVCILVLVCSSTIKAQNSIRGIISDGSTSEILLGATVYIPELQKGTVTDTGGYYLIQGIPNGHFNVQFSYMGYKTFIEHVDMHNFDQVIDILLQQTSIAAQEVIITGGRTCTQHENAIKIEQIREANLQNATQTNVMEKLAVVPGIDVVTKGNGIATPVIRGLSTSNIVLLNNGVRMENYQFSTNHPYLINESNVHNIEIIKGPASLLYGSDAVGGVINFVKETPAPVNSIQGRVNSEYHSNYQGFSNSVALKSSTDNVFGGIWASHATAMDYKGGENSMVPNSRNNAYSIKSNAGLRIKNGLMQLSYDYNKLTPGLVIPQAVTLVTSNSYQNDVWYQNLDNHILASNTTLFYNRLKLNIDFSYQYNQRKLNESELTPEFTMVNMALHSLTYQVKSKYHFSEKNNLVLAFQGLYQQNNNQNVPLRVLPNYTCYSNSIAGLWQYNFTSKIFYQLGFRYDNKVYDIPEQIATDKGTYNFNHLSRTYDNLSFSTGVTYKLVDPVLFRANIASAYRTPSIAEISQDGIHANRYEKGNSNLSTQRNVEGDISMHIHSNSLKLELACFYNRIFDYIFLAPTADTTSNGLEIYQYQQSNASIYGFEADFEWKPLSYFKIQTAYAHLEARQENGNYLPFIPQNKINSRFVFIKSKIKRIRTLELAINPSYAFNQSKPHEFEKATDSYFIINAYVRAGFKMKRQNLSAGIYVQNLLDEAYYDHLSTIKDMGYYNIGRNISIKLNIPLTLKQES